MRVARRVKLPWLSGLSLYDLIEIYFVGIAESAITYRAAAISFSFFMALFPFSLFILNLIPFIPIPNFQQDFMRFVEENVPPNTYDAIAKILNDILHNSHSGLLSTGVILSIFLAANGLNSILGGFETAKHVIIRRGFFRQYAVALGISIIMVLLLLLTVATIVTLEVVLQKLKIEDYLSDRIPLLEALRYSFLMLMILITVSLLFKFGTKHTGKRSFISVGSVFTTVLVIILSYFFGIWVVKFSRYNELYGSIGTLLILMFYIWANCIMLLLGFELNAAINQAKKKLQSEQ
ncbi:YihY/virulence factor BrkB family protein [Flavobacterium silvaticum]|uniref:YihY/virulence factor BrkB family protein n=1 Tax=Flavobacterium silvaticum TaxID=1852020 RepID=A0A972FKJ9_9FLAO|nr:YihY/virulence factor BrkB family protein [Flavobacterium silvaticum]NMH26935.1 YihY/virulence factor BrkB family protein [Flavobacterium silvaticum]